MYPITGVFWRTKIYEYFEILLQIDSSWYIELSTTSEKYFEQGIVDGSASKPALRQDTSYMVEKTCHDIAPYLGAFGAHLMPQWPIYGSKCVFI